VDVSFSKLAGQPSCAVFYFKRKIICEVISWPRTKKQRLRLLIEVRRG
jgi:hypothetical protein